MEIIQWSAYETGTYNELVIPDLIRALEENGRSEDAAKLRAHWEIKAKHFINDHPDLYASEYPFDSTAFESTHALAKYAMERLNDPAGAEFARAVKRDDAQQFLEEQMTLNLACRGTEPAYYWLGSDFRGQRERELYAELHGADGWLGRPGLRVELRQGSSSLSAAGLRFLSEFMGAHEFGYGGVELRLLVSRQRKMTAAPAADSNRDPGESHGWETRKWAGVRGGIREKSTSASAAHCAWPPPSSAKTRFLASSPTAAN